MSKQKWIMFKNYLHNELGIRKEDIQEWVKESIEEVASDYVENHLSEFTIERLVNRHIENKASWGRPELNMEIKQIAGKILAEKLDISVVKKGAEA